MRGFVLLSLKSQTLGMDGGILDLIAADQALRSATYHLEHMRILIGEGPNRFVLEERLTHIQTDACGRPLDFAGCKTAIDQLITYLYGRIVAQRDTDCDVMLLTNGEAAANIAALALGRVISTCMMKLFPIRLHMALLQDQYVHGSADAALFMRYLKVSNGWRPVYYASLNLLPWEQIGETRERTRKTVRTMVRAMTLPPANPMLLPCAGQAGWVETVSVSRLDPPVDKVRKIIYGYLTGSFERTVLTHVMDSDALVINKSKDFANGVKLLTGQITDAERKSMLPAFSELLAMMPVRDPDDQYGPEKVTTVDQAWEALYAIYGKAQASALYARINPSLDEMKARYDEMGRALTAGLLNQAIAISQSSAKAISNVPQLIEQLGMQMLSRLEQRHAGAVDVPELSHALTLNAKKREAIRLARLRHHCLRMVYASANKRLGEARKRFCIDMTRDAVDAAKRFFTACLTRLEGDFQQMRAVRMDERSRGFSYDFRLEDAYRCWCEHSALENVTAKNLYDRFTAEVFDMDYAEAAAKVCEGLRALFDARTQGALGGILANIDSFFSELDFRAKQLRRLGMEGDLSGRLLDFLASQQGQCPLLYQDTADHPFRAAARTLIFRTEGSEEARQFADLVARNGIPVVSDSHEKGVLMAIKYAGDVLDQLLVNINNPQ